MKKRPFETPRRAAVLPRIAAAALAAATVATACRAERPAPCGKSAAYLATWEIQGSGHTSPYDGRTVDDVRGVVTADFQQGTGGPYPPGGFYLQAHEPDCDGSTSDGLFVYTGSSPLEVSVGDLVEIDGGTVAEYRGPASFTWELTLTELDCREGCSASTLRPAHGLPAAEDYAPPADEALALAYNEAREGALVQVAADCTVVAAANPYDEMVLLRGAGLDRLHEAGPPHGQRIVIDGDGVAAAHCGRDGLGPIKTFDAILYRPEEGAAIYGPLGYGFDAYRVQQDDDVACLAYSGGDDSPYDPADNPAPSASAGTLTIATLNAWNLFDGENDPYKDDDVPAGREVELRLLKLADAICSPAGLNRPLVIALQEVENDAVLQRLADAVTATCGVAYERHTIAGPDDRSADLAFVTRADRVAALAVDARQGCSTVDRGVDYEPDDDPPGVDCGAETPYYLHSRPPLHLEAQVELDGGDRIIHLVNNHWKSRLPHRACSEAGCTDWRLEEARHVAGLVDGLLADDPGALVVVLGDLNDGVDSAVLDVLDETHGALTNLWDGLAGPPSTGQGSIAQYTTVYEGIAQAPDHVLVSDALAALPRAVSPRHLNVDWPASHLADASMFRCSDHDPILVALDFSGEIAPLQDEEPPPDATPAPSATAAPTATPAPTPDLTPISDVTSGRVGEVVTVEGTAAGTTSFSAGFKITLDDGTGQVTLLLWHDVYDDCWDAGEINLGARVRARGEIDEYGEELQIQPRYGGDVKVVEEAAAWPTPRGAGTLAGSDEGSRVTIEGEVTRVEGLASAVKVFVRDESGEALVFIWRNVLDRIAGNTGLGTPGTRVRVAGTVQIYRNNLEVVPALPADVVVLGEGE